MPVENFTTYTSVDPNEKFTITSTRITFDSLTGNETAYVYKDMGENHFDGDFEHLVTISWADDSVKNTYASQWALTNELNDLTTIYDNSGSFLAARMTMESENWCRIYILEIDSGDWNADITPDAGIYDNDTPYYFKIIRDESVGSYGTIYLYIYDDAERTSLVDTLSVVLHSSKKDFRYIFGAASFKTGQVVTVSGYNENLDLQEAIATNIKSVNGLLKASIKSVNGLAIADIKSINGLT